MSEWFHPTAFSSWSSGSGSEEDNAIQRVLSSGRLTMGPEVDALEHEFAAWHGMKYGVAVNSGSSANLIAVAALFHKSEKPLRRVKIGAVLVPAVAWSTKYAPLVQYGLDLRLLDISDTWNAPVPDWYPRTTTKLIVACSILGNPAYEREWKHQADSIDAYLLVDNCESLGAFRDGALTGTLGILNTFSFFFSHQIGAIEGGMILTNDAECDRLCRMLRAHGWSRDVEKPERFEDEYDFQVMGYNVRPTEISAAVGREQLKKLVAMNDARRENYRQFVSLTDGLPIWHPKPNGLMSPFGLQFECESAEQRADLVRALRAEGIDCRLPTGGSFRLHKYGAPWADQKTPRADDLHRRGLFIGNAPYLIPDKIERAVRVMRGALERQL